MTPALALAIAWPLAVVAVAFLVAVTTVIVYLRASYVQKAVDDALRYERFRQSRPTIPATISAGDD
jgi:hypothetical protein